MPVYNGARFLDRAVDSLRRQTFPDWELLAVDDGSADDSAARLSAAAAADPRVRVFRHPTNRGVSAARNTALAAAAGPLLAYLDCDDEFYPDHLARAWADRGRGDVLVFRYDLVEGRPGHPGLGRVTAYDPEPHFAAVAAVTFTVPLGVVHHRALIGRVGGFDETLGRHRGADEEGDLWRRFVSAGAVFAFIPHSSGRYHVRADSLSRTRPPQPDGPARPSSPPPRGESPPRAVRAPGGPDTPPTPRGPAGGPGLTPGRHPRVLFASYHCYHDSTSGAAVCTRDLFAALTARGWRVGAFTGPHLDDPVARPVGSALTGRTGVAASGTAGRVRFRVHTSAGPGGFPVTVFTPDHPTGPRPSAAEAGAFLGVLDRVLDRFRPDVVLTYGGDLASAGVAPAARRVGAKAVFWLHNFAYPHRASFAGFDAVVVPSAFSRAYHRRELGLECVAIPPVIDPARVRADRPGGGTCLTFVNPVPEKGLFLYARLAEILGRSRPDIPLLVVEGRGRTDWLGRSGVDLSGVGSFRRLANTPDPRPFYRASKLVLVPSAAPESFGLVAAEALLNGIPVVASDRGALPEVVGAGGTCLPLPGPVTARCSTPPAAADAGPWVGTILRLWDSPAEYEAASAAALAAAEAWRPDKTIPRWEAFLANMSGIDRPVRQPSVDGP